MPIFFYFSSFPLKNTDFETSDFLNFFFSFWLCFLRFEHKVLVGGGVFVVGVVSEKGFALSAIKKDSAIYVLLLVLTRNLVETSKSLDV